MTEHWPCLAAGRPPAGGVRLKLAVVPGARKAGADGLFDGALRVRVRAPPVEGQANEALLGWLAAELGLPRRALALVAGPSGRRKTVAIDAPLADVRVWLDRLLAGEVT